MCFAYFILGRMVYKTMHHVFTARCKILIIVTLMWFTYFFYGRMLSGRVGRNVRLFS